MSEVLVDPQARELAAALDAAVSALRSQAGPGAPGVVDFGGLAGRLFGLFGPLGPPAALCTTPDPDTHDPDSLLALAWWTDPHGRRHFRIVVRQELCVPWDRQVSPLRYVYPDRTVLREHAGRAEVMAFCGCGNAGRPDDLHWAGPCCGPCADHREERAAASLPPSVEAPVAVDLSSPVVGLVFSPDGRRLAASRINGSDVVLDIATLRPAWPAGPNLFGDLAFAPAGGWLVSSPFAGRVAVVDTEDGTVLRTIADYPAERPGWPFAVAPDGTRVAVGEAEGVAVYADGARPLRYPHSRPDALRFTPDGSRLVGTFRRGACVCLDAGLRPLWERPGATGSLALSPDGATAAVATQTDIELLEVATGRVAGRLTGRPPSRAGLAFHPRLQHLVSASLAGEVCLWSLSVGRLHATFRAAVDTLTALALSPDGRTLATGWGVGMMRLWPWEDLIGV